MSQLQVESRPVAAITKTRVTSRPTTKRKAPPALERCLIVSTSEHWSDRLQRAAKAQGWDPIVCSDAEEGARAAIRNRMSLAIIDLMSSGQEQCGEFKELAEMLASNDGSLLMVCGRESDAMLEIWARQLGVWAYLPGVDDECDLALLCGEAKIAVHQLQSQPNPC